MLRINKIMEISNSWAEFFDLKMNVEIKKIRRSYNWGMAEWTIEEYNNGKEYHYIRINMNLHESNIELIGSIIHELIHAKQYEKNREVCHDVYFWRMVEYVESMGFIEIASREYDIDKEPKK